MNTLTFNHNISQNLSHITKRGNWTTELAEVNRFWWKRPQIVRILMYMDGQSFNGGSFHGLQHVINAVTSDPWPWASFQVTTANRYNDVNADNANVTLTDLDLDSFDEVWLFGISSDVNLLSNAEVAALENFMDQGGGVLTTGDHASLGRGLSGRVKRIKDMRMYPAPAASSPGWNTTIRDANLDGNYSFGEQSDSTPQVVRPKYHYYWSSGSSILNLKKAPHPLLCSEGGILRKLPDHQHEGQVVIPTTLPVADWPKTGSYQAKPEVVAWGKILDPAATNSGDEFPVIGAYNGHNVACGRIVADSTWHHWFDINLNGFDTSSDDYKDIISYYQNVAAWLAPQDKQAGMRNGVFWLALHENIVFEHTLAKLPPYKIIPLAMDALGRWAPQCLTLGWLLEFVPIEFTARLLSETSEGPEVRMPLVESIAAEAMAELQQRLDLQTGKLELNEDFTIFEKVFAASTTKAHKRLVADMEQNLKHAKELQLKLAEVKQEALAEV